MQQIFFVLFALNDSFCYYLAGDGADAVHFGIPKLEYGLPFKPPLADEEAINDARSMFFAARFFRCLDDLSRDYRAVCFGDS